MLSRPGRLLGKVVQAALAAQAADTWGTASDPGSEGLVDLGREAAELKEKLAAIEAALLAKEAALAVKEAEAAAAKEKLLLSPAYGGEMSIDTMLRASIQMRLSGSGGGSTACEAATAASLDPPEQVVQASQDRGGATHDAMAGNKKGCKLPESLEDNACVRSNTVVHEQARAVCRSMRLPKCAPLPHPSICQQSEGCSREGCAALPAALPLPRPSICKQREGCSDEGCSALPPAILAVQETTFRAATLPMSAKPPRPSVYTIKDEPLETSCAGCVPSEAGLSSGPRLSKAPSMKLLSEGIGGRKRSAFVDDCGSVTTREMPGRQHSARRGLAVQI
jgi:hypothetical protein